jgi:hypothetical protein
MALGDDAMSNDKPQPPTVTPLIEKLKAALKRATDNNPNTVAQLSKFFDDHPEFWKVCGDLAGATRAGWIGLLAGDNIVLREATLRQLDRSTASGVRSGWSSCAARMRAGIAHRPPPPAKPPVCRAERHLRRDLLASKSWVL